MGALGFGVVGVTSGWGVDVVGDAACMDGPAPADDCWRLSGVCFERCDFSISTDESGHLRLCDLCCALCCALRSPGVAGA